MQWDPQLQGKVPDKAVGALQNRPMLRQDCHDVFVSTKNRGLYEITAQISEIVRNSRLQTGLCTLHIRHTSASLLIQENADPEVRRDLDRFFERLVPDGDAIFEHTAEGNDDMPAHVRTALTTVNLSVPITAGRLALGTWQGIYVWEHRTHPHRRSVTVHLIGE
jgi:secondary thiamine-phosphate synthase enzyme